MKSPIVFRRRYERDLATAKLARDAAADAKADALEEARVSREVQRFQIGKRNEADQTRAALRRQLELSERARRQLDETCRELTAANAAMCERSEAARARVCLVKHQAVAS